jgi:flavodoxin
MKKNALIVYYSRTGNTRKVAEAIQAECGADIEGVTETASRSGFFGSWRSGLDVLLSRKAVIRPLKHDVADYELVIIGTPVWMSAMSAPVKTLMESLDQKPRRMAAFCTQGGRGGEKALNQMENFASAPLEARLVLNQAQVESGGFDEMVTDFILALKP